MSEEELFSMMMSMSVSERVDFVDAFVNVLSAFNPRFVLMVESEEE